MLRSSPDIRGTWRTDGAARAVYAEAAGIHQIVPVAVAVPADAEDLVRLAAWASANDVSLTPRGAGSSMAGGAVGPGVAVDLSALNDVGPVDESSRTIRAGPGAICADLDAAARRAGLRFPVSPSSARFCTVGGMAATNAAGAASMRFGPMRAWVSGLECVFADASRGWVRRGASDPDVEPLRRLAGLAPALQRAERETPTRHAGVRKESSGYGLSEWALGGETTDLLIGSEGTLALFTSLELRLAPLPAATASLLAAFPSIETATTAAVIASELNATACELLDRTFLDIARSGGRVTVPADADAVLLVEVEESSAARLNEVVHAIETSFRNVGASLVQTALDPGHARELWHLRHAASPILAALATATASMQVIEDGAVPPTRLPEYVRGVRRVLAEHGTPGVLFGHAGDGHLHANILVDTHEVGWQRRVEAVFGAVTELVVSLGGTMAGEHGDGRLRAGVLGRLWPVASVERMGAVKSALDPAGILNPGVKLPAPNAPPLGAPVKYDTQLPALPPDARRVLDRVQRERCWHRNRLTLLAEEAVG